MTRWARAVEIAGRLPGTLCLLALLLVGFGLEHLFGGGMDLRALLRWGALRADRVVEHQEYWRLVTPMFLHYGAIHLALNSLALLQLGALVELIWGTRRMVMFFVASGVVASLASIAFGPSMVGGVGASGAILGLAGVLLGAGWFGDEALRLQLDEVRTQLRRAVLLTFLVGIGLNLLSIVGVDNWGHAGGLLCGLLLAWGYPDPWDREDRGSTPAFLASVSVVALSVGFASFHGPRVVEREGLLDTARILADSASRRSGQESSIALLVEMLEWYDGADASAEGVERFTRGAAKLAEPELARDLTLLAIARHEGRGGSRDRAAEIAAERWFALDPNDPQAANALAWHLVVRPTVAWRDPERAEALSRRSLERIPDLATSYGRTSRAMFLDTLAEALFQQGRLEEALAAQEEAVQLARELDLAELAELSARLERIEAARGAG